MALTKSNRGTELNQRWNVGAAHALYIHDGHWYHHLKRFPGALFDRHGYILFSTREEYLACSHLSIGKQISVAKPGISAIPGYVWVISPTAPDLDVHSSSVGLEGEARLVLHLIRERDKSLVKLKKKNASSRVCAICKFSFGRTYGSLANANCEVHHLLPLSELEQATEIKLEDLAILCANCHRVVHLHNPPYTLQDVRDMLQRSRSGTMRADVQQKVQGDVSPAAWRPQKRP